MTVIETKEIKLTLIDPPETLTRFNVEMSDIDELAQSIRELGLLQPLVVRKYRRRFRLIAGNRRFAAMKMLGEKTAPCRVVDADVSTASAMTVVENLQRQNLNPVEEAVALQELKNSTGWTDATIGLKVGKRREYIARSRALLDLDEDSLDALAAGELKAAHAYELRRVQDPDRRAYWRHWTIQYGATVRQLRDWIRDDLARSVTSIEDIATTSFEAPEIDPDQYMLRCNICDRGQNEVLLRTMWVCQDDYRILKEAIKLQEGAG